MPRHLVIIGGGPIGLEMAQAHRRLGSEVTVIEAQQPLAKDDPELAAVVLDQLRDEGIAIMARTAITSVTRTLEGIAIETAGNGTVTGSHLLVAAGRKPNIVELGLDVAGIAFTPRGITVDAGLRTSNRKVYAIGDVAGGLQLTHVSGYHAGLVIRSALFGLPVKADAVIPWVTYTDPELANVGLTEAEARAAHGDGVKVLRWPFRDNDRAQAEASSAGLVKVVVGRGGRILGAAIAGPQAGELIQPWVHAMTRRLRIGAMITPVAPYPTRGEASRRAAITHFADYASNSLVRGVIRLVGMLNR